MSRIKQDDYCIYFACSPYDMILGNDITAQISWIYNICENWSVGIGTGFYSYNHSFSFEDSSAGDVYHDKWVNSLPLYVRGQYAFGTERKFVRPYIACDLGGLIHLAGADYLTYSRFIVEPQVGVKLKDKFRVALGCATYNAYGNKYSNVYKKKCLFSKF